MHLPEELKLAIEEQVRSYSKNSLQSASQNLSKRYREDATRKQVMDKNQFFIKDASMQLAYILSRMPATFESIKKVLEKLDLSINYQTALDIGSGPGTVMWALDEAFSNLEITNLEQDPSLIALGKKLISKSRSANLLKSKWIQSNVLEQASFPTSDLITISYSLGEWDEEKRKKTLDLLFQAAKKTLVIIEPGTMAGFNVIKSARQHLIDKGAFVIAPCPHAKPCPMKDNDWCHFSARVARSTMQRQVKNAELGYEDEKFSYVILSKTEADLPDNRILRHPQKRTGHISFTLCTKTQGIVSKIVSKKDGEFYKRAKELEWGDVL